MLAQVTAERAGQVIGFRTANVYRVADSKVQEAWPRIRDVYGFDAFLERLVTNSKGYVLRNCVGTRRVSGEL